MPLQRPKPTLKLQMGNATVACTEGSRSDEAETYSGPRHIPTGPRTLTGTMPRGVGRVKTKRHVGHGT